MASLRHHFRRKYMAVLVDACIVVNAYTLASLVLFARWAPLAYYDELLVFLPIAVVIHFAFNLRLGLYRGVGRYAGLEQGLKMSQASLLAAPLLLLTGSLAMPTSRMHVLALVPVGGVIAFILMAGVRFYPRIFYERSLNDAGARLRMMIVGAGSAAEMIAASIRKEGNRAVDIVAFVDDNPDLEGLEIHGIPIHGPAGLIPDLVQRLNIEEILIAIPSAPVEEFRRLWRICTSAGVVTKTLRPLQSMDLGQVGLKHIREIEIDDVLGRQPVQTDYSGIRRLIKEKVVLISGAGGSIGSELAVQISHHSPARIILLDRDESALYSTHEKLKQSLFNRHEIVVADIQSNQSLERIFRQHRPELVFHAAAYKHVPLMELHPQEAIFNNVMGTYLVANKAGEYGAECFVNISTDKAVEPVNIMGATKYLGERLVEEIGDIFPATNYCSVRFGNVLGSRGSVIPIFRRQIISGGPLTVTHPEMTRYFMLIPEAVDLVLQAAAFEEENTIYILEMGVPVRVVDLARQMIDFMSPGKDIEIVFTGLRPGEKIEEKLIDALERRRHTPHPMIYAVDRQPESISSLLESLPRLFELANTRDAAAIQEYLCDLIDSYAPFDIERIGYPAHTDPGMNSGTTADDVTECWGYEWLSPDASASPLRKGR